MDNFERRALERARKFPTEQDALTALSDAYARLIDLGWRPLVYFKHHRDQTAPIASVCIGSDLVHNAEGDVWPDAILWRERDVPRRDRFFTENSMITAEEVFRRV